MFLYLTIYLSESLAIYHLSICLPVYITCLSDHLSVCLSVCPFGYLSMYPAICLSADLTGSERQRQKVLRTCSVSCMFTSKCASRLGSVQILGSPSVRGLRTSRFSEPTFWACQTHKSLKNTAFRNFTNISRARIFYRLTLLSADSSDWCDCMCP